MVLFSEHSIFTHNILNKLIKSQHLRLYLKTILHTIFDKLKQWCRWPESNRHGRLNARGILSPLRLPVPPHLQKVDFNNTKNYNPKNIFFKSYFQKRKNKLNTHKIAQVSCLCIIIKRNQTTIGNRNFLI